MKTKRISLAVALFMTLAAVFASAAPRAEKGRGVRPAADEDGIQVLFSPDGGCTEAVVEQIDSARSTVDVQAYSFTSAPIAKAVADAHARGVKVRVVLDKSQATQKYSSATYLFNHDVPVYIDREHAIAHNKVMLIDGRVLITGSFNFTKAAEDRNAENLLIIRGKPQVLSAYGENFEEHFAHAERYQGMGK